jgi:hypothetical protein
MAVMAVIFRSQILIVENVTEGSSPPPPHIFWPDLWKPQQRELPHHKNDEDHEDTLLS